MWTRSKFKSVLIGIFIVILLLMSADLFLMLYGGQYLAAMAVPSLPLDSIHSGNHLCASGSSIRCVSEDYLTNYTPEMVVSGWEQANVSLEHDSSGFSFYVYRDCNENILGWQYTLFHSDHHSYSGDACVRILVVPEKSGKTRVSVGFVWTKCLTITNEARDRGYIDYWSPLNSWCNDG